MEEKREITWTFWVVVNDDDNTNWFDLTWEEQNNIIDNIRMGEKFGSYEEEEEEVKWTFWVMVNGDNNTDWFNLTQEEQDNIIDSIRMGREFEIDDE